MFNMLKEKYISFLSEPQKAVLDENFEEFVECFVSEFDKLEDIDASFEESDNVIVIHSNHIGLDILYISFDVIELDHCIFNVFTSEDPSMLKDYAQEIGSAAMFALQVHTEWSARMDSHIKNLKKDQYVIHDDKYTEEALVLEANQIPFKLRMSLNEFLVKQKVSKMSELLYSKKLKYKISIMVEKKKETSKDVSDDSDLDWL